MEIVLYISTAFLTGMVFGKLAADRIWRRKGDHEYMNRMESGGRLYIVKQENFTSIKTG